MVRGLIRSRDSAVVLRALLEQVDLLLLMDGGHQVKQRLVQFLVISLRSNFLTGRIVLKGV